MHEFRLPVRRSLVMQSAHSPAKAVVRNVVFDETASHATRLKLPLRKSGREKPALIFKTHRLNDIDISQLGFLKNHTCNDSCRPFCQSVAATTRRVNNLPPGRSGKIPQSSSRIDPN